MTNAEIEALAGDALDIAARHIQDTLGVKTGDVAGQVFSSDTVRDEFVHYVRTEIAYRRAAID